MLLAPEVVIAQGNRQIVDVLGYVVALRCAQVKMVLLAVFRSHSPAPRQRSDYSLSSERRKDPRSPRDPPQEGDVRYARRSYSPSHGNVAADRNDKEYDE